MAVKIGINGFGRIGRMVLRAAHQKNIPVVGINNLGSTQVAAHLLKFDSTQGVFPEQVECDEKNLYIRSYPEGSTSLWNTTSGNTTAKDKSTSDPKEISIPISQEKDPSQIPWKDWGADIVLDCTGVFKDKEDFMKHCEGGAKKFSFPHPPPEPI